MHKNIKQLCGCTLLLGSLVSLSACNGGGSSNSASGSSSNTTATSYMYSADSAGAINEYAVTPSAVTLVGTLADPDSSAHTVQIKHDASYLYVLKQAASSNQNDATSVISVYEAAIDANGNATGGTLGLVSSFDLPFEIVANSTANEIPTAVIEKASGGCDLLLADNGGKNVWLVDLATKVTTSASFASLGLADGANIQSIIPPKPGIGSDVMQIISTSTSSQSDSIQTSLGVYRVDTAIGEFLSLATHVTPMEDGYVIDSYSDYVDAKTTPSGATSIDSQMDTKYAFLTPNTGLKVNSTFYGTGVQVWANTQDLLKELSVRDPIDLLAYSPVVYDKWLFFNSPEKRLKGIDMYGSNIKTIDFGNEVTFDLLRDLK